MLHKRYRRLIDTFRNKLIEPTGLYERLCRSLTHLRSPDDVSLGVEVVLISTVAYAPCGSLGRVWKYCQDIVPVREMTEFTEKNSIRAAILCTNEATATI